jgi:hypothetical protein
MIEDHARLDACLRRAEAGASGIDAAAFEEFRGGLLRHIGMEEKILLPAARARRSGATLEIAPRLKLEHSALALLMVPTPTRALLAEIRELLGAHNLIEEGAGGLYDQCEELLGADEAAMLERLRAAPPVPLAPHFDGPQVPRTAKAALHAAQHGSGAA